MNRNKQLIIDIVHLYTPHIITLADIEIVVNIRIFFICLFVSVSVCLCMKIFQGLLIFFPVYIVLHHIWKISGKSSLFCSVETFFENEINNWLSINCVIDWFDLIVYHVSSILHVPRWENIYIAVLYIFFGKKFQKRNIWHTFWFL